MFCLEVASLGKELQVDWKLHVYSSQHVFGTDESFIEGAKYLVDVGVSGSDAAYMLLMLIKN